MRKEIHEKPGIVSEMGGATGSVMAQKPKAMTANKDSF